MRRTAILIAILVISASCRSDDDSRPTPRASVRATATPATPEPRPEVQLEGTVRLVLSGSESDALDPGDSEAVTPRPSPAGSPVATSSATAARGAGIVIEATALSQSLTDCGLEKGDTVAIYWPDTSVFEPNTVPSNSKFPASLLKAKVLVVGTITDVAGQCVVDASRIQVGGNTAVATATPRRTPRVTPTPRRTGSPLPSTAPPSVVPGPG